MVCSRGIILKVAVIKFLNYTATLCFLYDFTLSHLLKIKYAPISETCTPTKSINASPVSTPKVWISFSGLNFIISNIPPTISKAIQFTILLVNVRTPLYIAVRSFPVKRFCMVIASLYILVGNE